MDCRSSTPSSSSTRSLCRGCGVRRTRCCCAMSFASCIGCLQAAAIAATGWLAGTDTATVRPAIARRRPPCIIAQVEIVHFQTDAESVGEVLCARAKDLNAVALVMARQVTCRPLLSPTPNCTSTCQGACCAHRRAIGNAQEDAVMSSVLAIIVLAGYASAVGWLCQG